MRKDDLVKSTVYLTDSRFVDDYRLARSRIIGDATLFTSTLVVVDGLASPDILIEIEVWAAKV
jgi:enamine deaminase RidA (YjgF/YER057c/UK114 family)